VCGGLFSVDRISSLAAALNIVAAGLWSVWLCYLSRKDRFHHVIGSKTSMREAVIKLRKRILQGIAAAVRLFPQRI